METKEDVLFCTGKCKGLSTVIVPAFLSHCLSPSKLTHQMNDEVCKQKHHHHLEIPGERATGQEALQSSNLHNPHSNAINSAAATVTVSREKSSLVLLETV